MHQSDIKLCVFGTGQQSEQFMDCEGRIGWNVSNTVNLMANSSVYVRGTSLQLKHPYHP